jgi:hypothetical protein
MIADGSSVEVLVIAPISDAAMQKDTDVLLTH